MIGMMCVQGLYAQRLGDERFTPPMPPSPASSTCPTTRRTPNNVPHIFELVKAYGSTSQVQYDRTARVWQRRENIAVKHQYEVAVNPFSGEKLAGDGHAPLVYVQDPRVDLPAELQARLAVAIDGSDDRIVAGWLQYSLAK